MSFRQFFIKIIFRMINTNIQKIDIHSTINHVVSLHVIKISVIIFFHKFEALLYDKKIECDTSY